MVYELLADAVVFVHFLWILFLISGAVWGVRHRAIKVVHVGGLFFAFVINVFGLYCPLTDLETWLRAEGSPSGAYGGSFIAHYLEKLIYLDVPEYIIALMSVALCAFNAWVYLRRRPASP
jgi:hypothetical protein